MTTLYVYIFYYIWVYIQHNGMSHVKILTHMSEQACSVPFEVEVEVD
jgi:hypothetical protein